MNHKPIMYYQTDTRWKNVDYSTKGESTTIGRAGCGPTAAAMLLATIVDRNITPVTCAKWALNHGYKALNNGTYFSYFVPQFAAYGIDCKQLTVSDIRQQPNNPIHDQVFQMLQEGYYIIACMSPGTWTTGGHFIVPWWVDDKVRINDPASSRDARINGDIWTFRREAKHYWSIDARNYNQGLDHAQNTNMSSSISGGDDDVKLPVLKKGSTGSTVKAMQSLLKGAGYTISIDGSFGPGTEAALKKYQQSRGLTADGYCGPMTWAKLLGVQ